MELTARGGREGRRARQVERGKGRTRHMDETKRILVVEPNEADARSIEASLGKAFLSERVTGVEEALARLAKGGYDAAIVSPDPSDPDGRQLCDALQKEGVDLPIVFLHNEDIGRSDSAQRDQSHRLHLVKSTAAVSFLPVVLALKIDVGGLDRENRLLHSIIENASDCVIVTDSAGHILSANHAVKPIFGYDPAELTGQLIAALFPPEIPGNNPDRLVVRTVQEGQWYGAFSGRKRDSTTVPMELGTYLARGSAGKPDTIICLGHDLTERTKLISRLERLAVTDELTGLNNYRYFSDRLSYEFRRAQRYGVQLSCIMLDLDYFKSINDTYGHRTGDKVLQALAEMYRQSTREVDIVARYGGEEFVVLLPNTGREGARACAEKMRRAIGDKPISVGAVKVHISASLGASTIAEGMKDEEELLRQADTALLIAKQRGRNRVCEWAEVVEAAVEEQRDAEDGAARLTSFRDRIAKLNADIKPGYIEYIKPLVEQLESSVTGAFAHSSRVARYAARLASAAALPQSQIDAIRCAALLHDLGKAAVPGAIWQSSAKLTSQETEAVRQHPLISESLVGEVAFLREETMIIRHHHERWDGTGYPDGFAGEKIPLGARVLALCNTYDALRHDRPYRKALSKEETMHEIVRCAGAQFDPNLVKLFENVVQEED